MSSLLFDNFQKMVLKKNFAYYLNQMETLTIESTLQIEDLRIKKASLVFRAINHPLRQQMLRLLHLKKQMTVSALYDKLGLEQSVASQHLAILRKAKFVTTRKDGKYIHYSVSYERFDQFYSIVTQLIS